MVIRMGIRLILGRSGSGKSSYLYDRIMNESESKPEQRFFVLVPDQFTMQTQKDIVSRHPKRGIMNIEVMSFNRLAFRIFSETGFEDLPVLDDSGKSLILRKVAGDTRDDLEIIGTNLKKNGYLHEVKSAVSEFMQYGIGENELDEMIACAGTRKMLQSKLRDLKHLLNRFEEYIEGNYITSEETLSRLASVACESDLLRESVIALDGFTGFTPIQWKVIRELSLYAKEVIITVVMDKEQALSQSVREESLFYLGQKTVQTAHRICEENQIAMEEVEWTLCKNGKRHEKNPVLAHLEENIFRFPVRKREGDCESIKIMQMKSPKEEVRTIAEKIEKLVRTQGYRYQDIAVVTGDLDKYARFFKYEFSKLSIPCFIDQTRAIALNPFVECIRGAISVATSNFSYASVFHFLRSGILDFESEEMDKLENYVLETGIRGKKKWYEIWTRQPKSNQSSKVPIYDLEEMNRIRLHVTGLLEPLLGTLTTAEEITHALYKMITSMDLQRRLAQFEAGFQESGDRSRAKEYAQIYRLIMELLDQIVSLIGKEEMDLNEYAQILEAGLGEIQVGTIPISHDRVTIGDIERSRLKEIKILFFVGINDGIIPKMEASGGLISDVDRVFLEQHQFELAPSPRRKMYMQRLYLYLNMTKPTEFLYLSFCEVSAEGKTLRPGYLIAMIRNLFPGCILERLKEESQIESIINPVTGIAYLSDQLREYAARGHEKPREIKTVLHALQENEEYRGDVEKLVETAFFVHTDSRLQKKVAGLLYGEMLENSISRLEKFAGCAYSHFLQYGLGLTERQAYQFESSDLGNVYHSVLERFAAKLNYEGKKWEEVSIAEMEQMIDQTVTEEAALYGGSILYSSAQLTYLIERIRNVMKRSVQAIQYQLRKGSFTPSYYEVPFSLLRESPSVSIKLSEENSMLLKGRIDRIDVAEEGEIYVKVVDYKSGNKNFDPSSFYYGLQLQLLTYLNAAVDMMKEKNPGKQVVPAAALYYHIANPILPRETVKVSEEAWQEALNAECKTKGIVNGQSEVVTRLDSQMDRKSDVIPVEYDKNGELTKRCSAYDAQALKELLAYTTSKVTSLGQEILDGQIQVNPYEDKNGMACTYCPYHAICKLDGKIPGYGKRILPNLTKEQVIEKIKEGMVI